MVLDGKRKLMSFIGLLMIVGSIYPGIMIYLEANYGALDNQIVMETYVPWIFHMLVIQFVFFVGLIVFGIWLIFAMGGDEEELPAVHHKKKKKHHEKSKSPGMPEKSQEKVYFVNGKSPGVEPASDDEITQAPEAWKTQEFE